MIERAISEDAPAHQGFNPRHQMALTPSLWRSNIMLVDTFHQIGEPFLNNPVQDGTDDTAAVAPELSATVNICKEAR